MGDKYGKVTKDIMMKYTILMVNDYENDNTIQTADITTRTDQISSSDSGDEDTSVAKVVGPKWKKSMPIEIAYTHYVRD